MKLGHCHQTLMPVAVDNLPAKGVIPKRVLQHKSFVISAIHMLFTSGCDSSQGGILGSQATSLAGLLWWLDVQSASSGTVPGPLLLAAFYALQSGRNPLAWQGLSWEARQSGNKLIVNEGNGHRTSG